MEESEKESGCEWTCEICKEQKPAYECKPCVECERMACNSCTYTKTEGEREYYYCLDCWEKLKSD